MIDLSKIEGKLSVLPRFQWREWVPGDPVTVNRIVWDSHEVLAIMDVFDRDWFGPGHYVKKLSKVLAKRYGMPFCHVVNSGTSALTLTVQSLVEEYHWKPGDKILHPACTFPSSCNPLLQAGLVPVFVDIDEGTYNISVDAVIQVLRRYPETKGALIPHLLGNSPDMDALTDALGERLLIEDGCDTIGSKYNGETVGSFSVSSAVSFYSSHHITAGGVGGAFFTRSSSLYETMISMTYWGRGDQTQSDTYDRFIHRYWYETVGYDFQMTEIQAAFALAQLEKLDKWNKGRKVQFDKTYKLFERWQEFFVLPKSHPKAEPSWFGFPLLVKEDAPFGRREFACHLIENKIEIRPAFCNLTRQPAYQKRPDKWIAFGSHEQSNRVMDRAFFIPCWGQMSEAETEYMFGVITDFLGRYKRQH